MDWTATILATAKTPADEAYPLDGEDLLAVCTGHRPVFDRTLFWRTRTRDAARMGQWKYLSEAGVEHLFDLATDPGEKNDLRTKRRDVFDEIKRRYLTWNAQMLPRPAA